MDPHHEHGSAGSKPTDDMPNMSCSMNMLWNNQVSGVCVVFESWRITGPTSMLVSCIAVASLSYAYYWVQLWAKEFDRKLANELAEKQSYVTRGSPVIGSGIASGSSTPLQPAFGKYTLPPSHRAIRSGVAAFQVFLSFFLMLVAMTYNSYLIAAIIAGAFLGKWRLEPELDAGALYGADDRGLSCH